MNRTNNSNIELSIICPIYKSEEFINDFILQFYEVLEELSITEYEMIFVLDGISDNSLSIIMEFKKNDQKIKVLEFSRNFGHHYALSAGIHFSKGDYVMLIDSDLEVKPDILKIFYKTINESEEIDVVYAYQENRKGKFFEKKTGELFWSLFNFLSSTKLPMNILTERLMKRSYVESLKELKETNLFLGGMFHWVGYNQVGIPYKKLFKNSKSTYNIKRKVQLFINAISSFSAIPLQMLFYFGMIVSFLSGLYGTYLILRKILFPELIASGFTSLFTMLLFSLGIILLSIGLTGLYIEKIFNQVINRPNYIIRKIH